MPILLINLLLSFIPIVLADPIPSDWGQTDAWFRKNVGSFESRKATLLPELVAAESNRKVITVGPNGQFKKINDAINSIPDYNKQRVIVSIAAGSYWEKVHIGILKPFVTLYGDPENWPILAYNDNADSAGGTEQSATLTVQSNHFSALNMIIKNRAPRPDGKRPNAQAVAMLIQGDYASFYHCKFYGFQDTLMDDRGKHFYKDCLVRGTVDFIFGSGQTIFLRTHIFAIEGGVSYITAHARTSPQEPNGYVFAQCGVTGNGQNVAFLGRPWFDYARVIFADSRLGAVVSSQGWYIGTQRNAYFAEYGNVGYGARGRRPSFVHNLSAKDVHYFLDLSYIDAYKWLLPPFTL